MFRTLKEIPTAKLKQENQKPPSFVTDRKRYYHQTQHIKHLKSSPENNPIHPSVRWIDLGFRPPDNS
jgi:hypothetical protein